MSWTLGVEVELLAPPGRSRLDLARALTPPGGQVRRYFHRQSEPSKVPGTPVFESLTPGFEVRDARGDLVARCVDDLTLQADLDRQAPPRPGWYRVVSDDHRLLSLVARHADPALPPDQALASVAALFGTPLQRHPGGMVKVVDELGAPVCIAAPQPGERERPCELITPPMGEQAPELLTRMLATARALGFNIPRESATHLHFDGRRLQSAPAFAALVEALHSQGAALRQELGVNPHCVRLGPWPDGLLPCVRAPDFRQLPWEQARQRLAQVGLSKYCDYNLKNLVHPLPDKCTFELRVLPGHLHPEPILAAAARVRRILERAAG